jgi:hypothetical protein
MDSLVVARVEQPFTTQNNYLVLHSIYSTVLVDECWWYSLDFLLTSTNSSFPPLLGAVEYVVSFVRWKQSILSKSWSRKKEREKSRVLFGGYTPPLQLVHPPLYPSFHCRYIVVTLSLVIVVVVTWRLFPTRTHTPGLCCLVATHHHCNWCIPCDILPRGASETQVNTAGQHPETNEGNEVSLSHASQERWEMPKVCPSTLHDNGQELQETNLSATTMTALLSTDVQTYDAWTLIQHRNGKGGTNQALNGPKEQKVGPKKKPKVRPKVGKTKQSQQGIGSQLI